jgi:hypothetical protein
MEKIFDIIKLTAKTGLMFANCDGNYSDREKEFIDGFIAGIEQFGDVDEQLKADVLDTLNHQYELYPVIAETKAFLDGFNVLEKALILKSINDFAKKVIMADKDIKEAEKNNYEIWARELGIKKY